MPGYEAIGLIALVFFSFAFIHSLCVTGFIKGHIKRLLGETFVRAFYRFLYTCFSAVTTAGAAYLIFLLPDIIIWKAPFAVGIAMRSIQAGAVIFAMLSFRAFNSLEFIGLSQATRYIGKRETGGDEEGISGHGLITTGVYGIVRHPLYLAGIVIFSFNPVITRNWLTVSVLSDMYFIFGAFMEERRLIKRFGDEYRQYMKDVPRFLPGFRKGRHHNPKR